MMNQDFTIVGERTKLDYTMKHIKHMDLTKIGTWPIWPTMIDAQPSKFDSWATKMVICPIDIDIQPTNNGFIMENTNE